MKKIIIATDAWFPQVNGVVRIISDTKRILEKQGFEVFVIHPGLFFSIPFFFYKEIKFSFFAKNKIKKIIEKEKPDYIHIVTEGPVGLAARTVCLKKKLKFTTSYHTHFPYYIESYLKMRINFLFKSTYAYLKWFHNAGNATMVIAENLKKELEEHGFKNLCLWPLGVDTDFFQRNFQIPAGGDIFPHPVFVYFGRISREKNVEEYLKLNLSGTKLVIGGGPLEDSLEKRYGKEAIFVGYKKGKELVDMLSVCDVFVFPSKSDTFALSVMEAFACGIPVAAHDTMGQREIITDGIDGILDEDLEKAAIGCLKLSRENCRKKAMQFSLEKSAEYFVKNLVKN